MADSDSGGMATVGNFPDLVSAQLAQSVLRERGIATLIPDEYLAGVDWQLHLYGGVGHSFTNPLIDAWELSGFAYDAVADRRSWSAMLALFDEVFAPIRR